MSSTEQRRARKVFRQRSPMVIGVLFFVFGAFLLLSLASSWERDPNPEFLCWLLFGLAGVWTLFMRPSVQLDQEGVTLRNVIRDVHIPWPILDEVEARWNVKVFVGETGYTAWAISSQVQQPEGLRPGMLGGMLPTQLDPRAVGRAAKRGAGGAGSSGAANGGAGGGVTARSVAEAITLTRLEYDQAVAAGAVQAAESPQVRVRWFWPNIVLLALPLLAAVGFSLT